MSANAILGRTFDPVRHEWKPYELAARFGPPPSATVRRVAVLLSCFDRLLGRLERPTVPFGREVWRLRRLAAHAMERLEEAVS